jgi:hypothetical protein
MAASLAGLLLLPAIPQDQSYHLFADCRAVAGIPNFWNVVSNIPFIAIGAAGLWRFRDDPATIVLFLGLFLTGIGSSYYHWNPNDGTLQQAEQPDCERRPQQNGSPSCVHAFLDHEGEELPRNSTSSASGPRTAVALDRRPAALFLGAVFPRSRSAVAVSAVSAEVHWRILLDRCCGTLRGRQGV